MCIVARDGSPGWQLARGIAALVATALAFAALGQGSLFRRAFVAWVFGAVTTAIGIGIAVPHAAKAGWHAMTVVGLFALGAGVALTVAGTTSAIRGAAGWRRLFVAPAVLVAAVVVVFTLGQAVAATNVPRTRVGATTPGQLGMSYRDIEFGTADGVVLSGWYVPTSNGAVAVLLHGAGSTRSSVLAHAAVLERHGYGIIAFDARGHGRSGGRAMDFGWYGDVDIAAAVDFARDQRGVDPERIVAVGMSMGGEEAIGAAAALPAIRAVVAEGATNRVAADKAWLSDEFGVRGVVQEGLERLVFGATDLLTSARPPTSLRHGVATAAPTPVLLIAAGEVGDEPRAAAYIQSGSPDTVTVWVVAGSRHTGGLEARPDEWEERVVTFLDDALGLQGTAR